ncbi:hypothetical protein JCGZ_06846 [Jatropha curcas]|uniref:Uncharacterized protein n=1 Tax=Jatropha curcas TaxID=180498 RepID=A0A067KZR3_JATCU|nr:hypothetical protein JCGZ_06846 [Jatropha curcas]
MAKGRAFDSDGSSSRPRGGHGRGRSTRGRGGTIPPPSSSSTSGASSSAQPPMPPSLPSIPSSSAPLPGPVESSPASQRNETDGDGAGPSRHTGGSIYATETSRLLERQLAALRAHVLRMSDQPGAGTSSSIPPPATDQDVSTAQQQPLPSPLDLHTTDDTLVTPADTTTHPVGTPPGDTTLDRADDQPRRFDFGPF